jgi:hypothetical protein
MTLPGASQGAWRASNNETPGRLLELHDDNALRSQGLASSRGCFEPAEGPRGLSTPWCRSHRFDPPARQIADRHYNRQKVGSPQFVRTGSCCVFLTECGRGLWVTSWQKRVKHAWPGAWENTIWRNEGAGVASELIRQAVACTIAHYGDPPPLGMITMIDREKVKPTMVRGEPVYGWTYRKAGFVDAGETAGGKLVLQLHPSDMPSPIAARPQSLIGFALFARTASDGA